MKAPAFSSTALLLLLSPALQAQVPADDLLACRQITDSLERFACYESLEAGPTEGSAAGAIDTDSTAGANTGAASDATAERPQPAPRAPAPLPEAGAVSDAKAAPAAEAEVGAFGRPQPRVAQDERGQAELHDTIVKLERFTPNQWDVTLSSGQVWRQVTGKRMVLRTGDNVRIYPTSWGDNYRLSPQERNGYIEVQRLR